MTEDSVSEALKRLILRLTDPERPSVVPIEDVVSLVGCYREAGAMERVVTLESRVNDLEMRINRMRGSIGVSDPEPFGKRLG